MAPKRNFEKLAETEVEVLCNCQPPTKIQVVHFPSIMEQPPQIQLAIHQMQEWTQEEVTQLLINPGPNGCSVGHSIAFELQRKAKFDGKTLLEIWYLLERANQSVTQVTKLKLNDDDDQNKGNIIISLLSTWFKQHQLKFFHLFNTEQTKSILCKNIFFKGAGINVNSYEQHLSSMDGEVLKHLSMNLINNGKEQTLEYLIEQFPEVLESELMKIINWLDKQYITINKVVVNLKQLLERMEIQNKPPFPYSFLNTTMKYVQRESAIKQYIKYAQRMQTIDNSDPKALEGANIMFIGASPGVGKSRFAYELANQLELFFKPTIPNLKMINLITWFSNGSNFMEDLELSKDGQPIDLNRSIVSRIIYSYITHVRRYNWPTMNYSNQQFNSNTNTKLLELIYTDLGKISAKDNSNWLKEIFEWIQEKEYEEGKTLWIHFTLDEYNQVIKSLQGISTNDMFDKWLNNLSAIPCTLRGCYFTNLLSGTHIQDLSESSGINQVYLQRIELLNFNNKEQMKVYSNQEFPKTISHLALFNSLGGHARLIEYFGDCLREKTEFSDIMKMLLKSLSKEEKGKPQIGLSVNIEIVDIIIALCITRYPISNTLALDESSTESSLKVLRRSLILFLEEEGDKSIINIPLIVLFILVRHVCTHVENHFLNVFPDDFQTWLRFGTCWEDFEEFNAIFFTARLNSIALLYKKKIIQNLDLSQVFYGVEKIPIRIPVETIVKHQPLRNHFPKTNVEILPNVVYTNGEHADFADVFFLLTCGSKNIFCYLQVRHTRMVTSYSDNRDINSVDSKEVETEKEKLENYREDLKLKWKELETVFVFITNRTIPKEISEICIGSSLLICQFGPFAQALSHLNVAELPIMELSYDDFTFIVSSQKRAIYSTIHTNWKYESDKVGLLVRNLSVTQLKNLLVYVKEKEIITEAIKKAAEIEK